MSKKKNNHGCKSNVMSCFFLASFFGGSHFGGLMSLSQGKGVILGWEEESKRDHKKELLEIVKPGWLQRLVCTTLQELICPIPSAVVSLIVEYGHDFVLATMRNRLLGFECFICCYGDTVGHTIGMQLEFSKESEQVEISPLGSCEKSTESSASDGVTWQAVWDFLNDPANENEKEDEHENELLKQLQCTHCFCWADNNGRVLTFPRVELWRSLVRFSNFH